MILRSAKSILAVIILSGAAMLPVSGAQPIPADSREKLEEVFRDVCDRLWQINDQHWHQGNYERCIATLRLITELDPHDTEAYSNAAWLIWNAGRVDEAEAFLKQGITHNQDVDDLYFDLGFLYYIENRFAEAIDQLETAVTFKTHWRTWHLLAHAYERAGNKDEALNIWFMMEARDPSFPVPQMQIERILSGKPPPSTLSHPSDASNAGDQ